MAIDPALEVRVRALVAGYLNGPVPTDLVTEPVAMQAGTAIVYVRLIDAEPPVIRVFSPLLRDVDVSAELLGELNDLNGRLTFDRVFWRDRIVYAATERLAETLTATELRHAVDSLADHADYYDVRLNERFGGTLAFADNRENSR